MPASFTIELRNLRFFAGHGLYQEEEVVGNQFEADVTATCHAPEQIQNLDESIDYVSIYQILKEEFAIRRNLLESVCQTSAERIREIFPHLTSLDIVIRKMQPPITGFSGSVAVRYHRDF